MIMRIRRTLLSAAALFLAGCSSLLVNATPAPVYYQLNYQAPSLSCPRKFSQGVRIQTFSASRPFDQPAMVVKKSRNRVLFSSDYQWVAPPGILLAQRLQQDLALGDLFPQVVSADNATPAPLILTGHVYSFAWEKEDSGGRAELQVEVSLVDTERNRVLLRRNYRFTGKPRSSNDSGTFAGAMGELAGQFSEELRRDLCRKAPPPAQGEGHESNRNGP
jgi:ABC-type uncharacterized transport system auxiliary subunit